MVQYVSSVMRAQVSFYVVDTIKFLSSDVASPTTSLRTLRQKRTIYTLLNYLSSLILPLLHQTPQH